MDQGFKDDITLIPQSLSNKFLSKILENSNKTLVIVSIFK